MTAKECFREIKNMEAFIETKKQRIAALEAMAARPRSSVVTGMPRNPSPSTSQLADTLCKAADLETEVLEEERLLQEKKANLLDLIGSIPNPDCQSVIIKRYFGHRSWDAIANEMSYSIRWIYSIHGQALRELDKRLSEGGF